MQFEKNEYQNTILKGLDCIAGKQALPIYLKIICELSVKHLFKLKNNENFINTSRRGRSYTMLIIN